MSKRIALALLLLVLPWISPATGCALRAGGGPGRQAHDFSLVDVNPRSPRFGQRLSVSELCRERGLVLQFTASWCEYCRAELGEVQRLHAGGTAIVLMAADEGGSPESMLILAERNQLTAPILFVPEKQVPRIERHYSYEVLPATYVIDRTCKILNVHEGALPEGRLAQTIESYLR